jgi:hypothetical protein
MHHPDEHVRGYTQAVRDPGWWWKTHQLHPPVGADMVPGTAGSIGVHLHVSDPASSVTLTELDYTGSQQECWLVFAVCEAAATKADM